MRILAIDDIREFSDATTTVRTYQDGLYQLTNPPEQGWERLYIDHDLGSSNPDETGYKLLCYIEEWTFDDTKNEVFIPSEIIIVSSNPVGRRKMATILDRIGR